LAVTSEADAAAGDGHGFKQRRVGGCLRAVLNESGAKAARCGEFSRRIHARISAVRAHLMDD